MIFLFCRYLALESMCLLATSEFSHEAVKKHLETVILALKVEFLEDHQCQFHYAERNVEFICLIVAEVAT